MDALDIINTQIDEAYTKAYKLILNMDNYESKGKTPIASLLISQKYKDTNQHYRAQLKQLETDKNAITKDISTLNESLIKIEKEITTLEKDRVKNQTTIQELVDSIEWEACKKFMLKKKANISTLIPILSIMNNRPFTDEDVTYTLKAKSQISKAVLKYYPHVYNTIKQYMDPSKYAVEEYYEGIQIINQFILKQFESKIKLSKLEGDRLSIINTFTSKELELKVSNSVSTLVSMKIDEDSLIIAGKLDSYIVAYNEQIAAPQSKCDTVNNYYRRLIASIEKGRESLLETPLKSISIQKVLTLEKIEAVQENKPDTGILSLFGCCN